MSFFDQLPTKVSIYEVSPRDGLQNESAQVSTHDKVRLIDGLVNTGIQHIEVGSFVSAHWVPQMADIDQVCQMFKRRPGVVYSALCPNDHGLERALQANLDELAVFVSSSETHNQKNINKSIAQTMKGFESVIRPAVEHGLRVRGYISTLWGCPYEGDIDPAQGLAIAQELIDQGCYQISLGDTIGVGTPVQTQRIVELFASHLCIGQIALHLHDTRGTALANVLVGLECGVTTFDTSLGGLGGCPYAPGAAGNLATEDLVYTLHGMGIQTGIDLQKLWELGKLAEAIVGHKLPGKVHQAGVSSVYQANSTDAHQAQPVSLP